MLSFWQWSASDLASNALRGRVAEFLIAQALGIADGVRAEWDAFDLRSRSGATIEVKSAAYLQTWAQKAISAISFDIAPTRFWDAATNVIASESRRQADLYVFALLGHQDKATLDPMDVGQWVFFVLPTAILDTRLPAQKRMGLIGLRRLGPVGCSFGQLRETIETVAQAADTGEAPAVGPGEDRSHDRSDAAEDQQRYDDQEHDPESEADRRGGPEGGLDGLRKQTST